MNFGDALEIVKNGGLVARKGWNGENMFIFMGFPRVEVNSKTSFSKVEIVDAFKVFGCAYQGPTICMKTAQDTIVVGWLASQTDMLANDWIGIKQPVKPGSDHKT